MKIQTKVLAVIGILMGLAVICSVWTSADYIENFGNRETGQIYYSRHASGPIEDSGKLWGATILMLAMFIVPGAGLLFKQKWAWYLSLVVTTFIAIGSLGMGNIIYVLIFAIGPIILLTDRPDKWVQSDEAPASNTSR